MGDFGVHGGESPVTRALGPFGLGGDASSRPAVNTRVSLALPPSPRINHIPLPRSGCPGGHSRSALGMEHVLSPSGTCRQRHRFDLILIFFPLGSSMGFNKGFFWSKPLIPHHKQNPQNPSQSQFVPLLLSGFLVAFSWGITTSQCPPSWCLRKLSAGRNIRKMLPGRVMELLESGSRCGAGRKAPGGLGLHCLSHPSSSKFLNDVNTRTAELYTRC